MHQGLKISQQKAGATVIPTRDVLFITNTRIGDAVLTSGLLADLVETMPDARFTVACGPVAAPLFEALPRLARLIIVRKQKPKAMHWLWLWRQTVGTRWDLVVDLRSSGLSWFLNARRRRILSPLKTDEHRLIRLSRVLRKGPPFPPKLWVGPEAAARAEAILPVAGAALALGPTANVQGKQWPVERFVALMKRLTAPGQPFVGAPIVVLGAPGEAELAAPLLAAIPPEHRIDLVGTANLLTAFAVLGRSRLYIGNDSGLMHLAAAAGTPTVGLFGPTNDAHYAPWGDYTAVVRGEPYAAIVNAPGYDASSPHSYMTGLSVDAVEQAALALLQRSNSRKTA